MDEPVAGRGSLFPRQVRVSLPGLRGDGRHRLPDDLQEAHERQGELFVGGELRPAGLVRERDGLPGGIQGMVQADLVILRRNGAPPPGRRRSGSTG